MKQITEKDLKIEYRPETGHDADVKTVSFLMWCQEKYLALRNELEAAEEYVHNMVCDSRELDEEFEELHKLSNVEEVPDLSKFYVHG